MECGRTPKKKQRNDLIVSMFFSPSTETADFEQNKKNAGKFIMNVINALINVDNMMNTILFCFYNT